MTLRRNRENPESAAFWEFIEKAEAIAGQIPPELKGRLPNLGVRASAEEREGQISPGDTAHPASSK
jgi:hypothetical protein